MTPVLQNSEEWRGVLKKLDEIQASIARTEREVAVLKNDQQLNHGANVGKIQKAEEELESLDILINGNEDHPGLRSQMATLLAYGSATMFWAKAIAWILGFAIASGGLYAAWFESHHKISKSDPPNVSQSHAPQDAGVGPTHY